MPEIKISDNEAFIFMQFAALQFPGSIENAGTRSPIHILQSLKTVDYHEIPMADYHEGCILIWETDQHDRPEMLVKAINGEDPKTRFDPNKKDLAQWLAEDNNIDPDSERISCLEPEQAWDNMGFSLVRQDMMRLRRDLSNHIFGKAQIYSQTPEAFGRESGQLQKTMNTMLRIGSDLLSDLLGALRVETLAPWSYDATRQLYRMNPDKPFCPWRVNFKNDSGVLWALSVKCIGHDQKNFSDGLCAEHPILCLYTQNQLAPKQVYWPFHGDPCLKALERTKPFFENDPLDIIHRILAFALYSMSVEEMEGLKRHNANPHGL